VVIADLSQFKIDNAGAAGGTYGEKDLYIKYRKEAIRSTRAWQKEVRRSVVVCLIFSGCPNQDIV
jgi:hypothetical protein